MNGKRDETRGELAREEPPEYSPDGVDLTLIRWMLSLTPQQRLQVLQDHVNAIEKSRPSRADPSRERWTSERS
ncbi:MAG: hypothetical protein HZA52_06400 [Planctomycetes bacterium]|nr:hypothetical protein [Planctomycetota bacterium]